MKNSLFLFAAHDKEMPLNKLFAIIILSLIGMIIISSTPMNGDLKTLSIIILFTIAAWRALPVVKELITRQNAFMIDEER